jgi:rubrerythrin
VIGGGDDGFQVITSAGEVLALIGGEVVTPGGAALIAHMHGYRVQCVASSTDVPGGFDALGMVSDSGTCETFTTQSRLSVSPEGSVAEVESVSSTRITCPVGRRPAGLAPPATTQKTTPVADLFAEIARLEASAVAAFDVMIGELTELGAPPVLVTAARRARADEVRHTEMMGEICRAYGVEPMAPEIAAPQRRTPFEIALENAVEGCVRETYGSLVAAHQALKAMDPRVARAMEIIADDEIRHAELSWALAAWLEPRLSDEERARIEAAKRLAVAELAEAARETLDESIVRLAGMPDPPSHAAMIAQLATDIWA